MSSSRLRPIISPQGSHPFPAPRPAPEGGSGTFMLRDKDLSSLPAPPPTAWAIFAFPAMIYRGKIPSSSTRETLPHLFRSRSKRVTALPTTATSSASR